MFRICILLFITSLAVALSGCVAPIHVISVNAYNSTIDKVIADIEQQDYTFIGKEHDRRNELGNSVPYNNDDPNYSSWVRNELVNSDTYSFADSEGNTMSFTVRYKSRIDPSSGTVYYTEVSTSRCNTSNPKNYDSLCGDNSPVRMLDAIQCDLTVRP